MLKSKILLTLLLSVPAAMTMAQEAPTEPVAAEPAEAQTPTAYVQEVAAQIIAIVNTPAEDGSAEATARLDALRSTVSSVIDFNLLSQRTLGSHWDQRTPEEQAEFVGLLRDMVETSYTKNIGQAQVNENDYQASYTDERTRNNRATVEGTLTAEGELHYIEVKLEARDGSWIVYDIITDDVSLEESYAESFDRIITEDGWDALLQRMRERLEELRAE